MKVLYTFNLIRFRNKKAILRERKGKYMYSLETLHKKGCTDVSSVEAFYAYTQEEKEEYSKQLAVWK